MTYEPFFPEGPATLATLATVRRERNESVATVANVAGANRASERESVANVASVAGGNPAHEPKLSWHERALRARGLSAQTAQTAQDETFEERAAVCEFDGGLRRDHAEVLAALHAAPMAVDLTGAQFSNVIDAVARFLERRSACQGGR